MSLLTQSVVSVIIGAVCMLVVLWSYYRLVQHTRRRDLIAKHELCSCGYAADPSTQVRCPECGTVLADLPPRLSHTSLWWMVLMAMLVIFCGLTWGNALSRLLYILYTNHGTFFHPQWKLHAAPYRLPLIIIGGVIGVAGLALATWQARKVPLDPLPSKSRSSH